jgi:hypothetical protein
MAALQTHAFESTVQLKLGITPVVLLLPADVTVKFRKQGDTAFTTKVMTNLNFLSLGGGYYVIKWDPSEMGVLGAFFFTISGLAFDTVNHDFSIEPLPQELVVIPPDVCVIQGNLRDIGSAPMRDMQITFRAVNYPLQSGTSILSADKVLARTDSLGNFSAPLIRGMTVIVEIERTAIRNQFVVPDAPTALLNDLIVFPVI